MAHEYGHAIHDDAFGGYPLTVGCPAGGHNWFMVLGNVCAYVEGFADFFAVATMGPETGVLADIESNLPIFWAVPDGEETPDGRLNEGTVAAFLLDLIDPVGSGSESHDQVQYPASYVGQIIQTCDVRIGGPSWQHGIDIGWNVWCFDRAVDPFYFDRLPVVTQYREFAAEPTGWDRHKIRAIWLKNLFDETYSPPPPPAPTLDVQMYGWEEVRPQYQCHWNAAASGGSGSYTYQWWVNGELVGEDSDWLSFINSTGSGGSFLVQVVVSDGVLLGGTDFTVSVSSGAGECPVF